MHFEDTIILSINIEHPDNEMLISLVENQQAIITNKLLNFNIYLIYLTLKYSEILVMGVCEINVKR